MRHDRPSIEATNAQVRTARPDWASLVAILGILAIALLLRLYQIGYQELRLAETAVEGAPGILQFRVPQQRR